MSKVYEIVQTKIIQAIEEAIENGGTAPWRKPWKGGIPRNYITKKPYRGINLMLLAGGQYLTFNQIKDLQKKNPEIKLKKGSKSDMVVYWGFVEKKSENDNEEDEKYGFLKYYRVFHSSNVEGLKIDEEVFNFDNVLNEQCEELVSAYQEEVEINVLFGSNRAFYSPSNDKIVVPAINQYPNVSEYYATLFHEMIHSTGHITRLNRFDGSDSTIFGSKSYSKEELVAEIGANMLLAMFGMEDESQQENSIAYLYGWLTKIKKDPKFIVQAAQRAQKACDYILEFNPIETSDNESESDLVTN